MTPSELIAAFETLADAPDGVKRLRELVLQLAVRGKLVAQDPADEPADRLIQKILGRARANQSSPDELPFEIPGSWQWVQFSEIFDCRLGKMLDKAKNRGNTHPYLRNINVRWGSFDLSDVAEMRLEARELPDVTVRKGDLVICEGGEPGRSAVWSSNEEIVIQKALHRARPCFVESYYYQLHLRADCASGRIARLFTGATIKHLTGQALARHVVTLPPLAEQQRIVARVDELMGLLDRLEAARTAREEVRRAARDAALAALRDAEDAEAVEAAWARISGQMDALFIESEDVVLLRHVILDLGANGRLVPQSPGDEPAESLIARCKQARMELVEQGRVRKDSKAPQACYEAQLPLGWTQCLLQDCAAVFDPNPSHRYPEYVSKGVPLLSTREFSGFDGWDTHTAPEVSNDFWEYQNSICNFSENDIVFARKGRLGLARPMPRIPAFTFSHTVFAIKPLANFESEFLLWMLRRDSLIRWLEREMSDNTGVPTLGKAVLERFPIKVPPLAEQRRIVVKIRTLMALCDQLEARLTAARELQAQFAAAAVHHLDV